MNYLKVNNLTGWAVFGIATLVYWLTVEPTASFWDCGEFIAVSYKLEVPHPPGAPLFLLIGRFFSLFAFGDVERVAYWINISSVLSSGFSILFLFWTITALANKLMGLKPGQGTDDQNWSIMAAGLVGSLAYTFSDSFWFSAVEAEVYALSSFFTAFVVWAILKWEQIDDDKQRNRWFLLLAYTVGLSIGIHLLNLVAIPALGLIAYFKYYDKPTTWGIISTMAISGAIIMIIMAGVIPGLPSLAFSFELFFVNSLGLPFKSGIIVFGLLFVGGLIYGIIYSEKKEKVILNTVLLAFAFILIGYSSYTIVLIRSDYNPPIDENNPENVNTFVSYLKREQYGDRPLFYGQYFTTDLLEQKKGAPVYAKGEEKYEIIDYKVDPVYDKTGLTILPRMYSSTAAHQQRYREITGLRAGEKPNFGDNLYFMFKYQLGHMYMRYFMWNFAGRESDVQDAGWLSPLDAFKKVPWELDTNRGRNNYLFIPLILGLIGFFYQYRKDQKNFSVMLLLFFLTGAALVLYLNSPPSEPRERDYIYVGSFYVFAIWIGFAVLAIYDLLARFMANKKAAVALSLVVCLSCPAIMASENWDDHDRSDRYFSVDTARNFLASCAPNAILFTGGDNDTFPLWYVQEVEGFRTDVRVVVLSYFNTDWYIEQMMRPAYESEPFPFSLSLKDYRQGGLNDFVVVMERENIKGAISLEQYMKLVRDGNPALRVATSISAYNSIPSKSVYLNIDTTAVLSKGIIPSSLRDYMVPRMVFNIKDRVLEKKDLAILDILLTNNWERPIYFNNTSMAGVNIDIRRYVVQEGNTYRLLPVENPDNEETFVDTNTMYDNMMNNFYWRGLQDPTVYYTEDYRNFVLNHRASFNTLAEALLIEGDVERSKNALLKSLEVMPDNVVTYDHFSVRMVSLLMEVGEEEKAKEMASIMSVRADEMLTYMFDNLISDSFSVQKNLIVLNELARVFRAYEDPELGKLYEELFRKHYGMMN